MKTKKKAFYGWLILIISCTIMLANYGLGNGPMGLYLVSTTEALGMSRTQFSLLYTFRSVTMVSFNLFLGSLSHKLGLRRMIFIGCCSVAVALLTFSFATSAISFYLGGLFLGFGFATSSTGALSTLCRNWFYAHRGLFTGIVLAASGFGSSLGSSLVAQWIANHGWRASYRISAVIVIVVAVLGVLIIRNSPEDIGAQPFGAEKDIAAVKAKSERGVPFKEALRRPQFYIVMACMVCIGMLTNPVYTNVSPQIVDAGYPQELAANVLSVFFVVLAICKIVLGQCYDSFGFRRTLCLCFAAEFIGIIILLIGTGPIGYYAFGVIFARAVPLETVMMPFFVTTIFGEKYSATYLGIALALNSLGVGIGNPIISAFYDAHGTYRYGLIIFFILAIIVFLLLLYCSSKKHSLVFRVCGDPEDPTATT